MSENKDKNDGVSHSDEKQDLLYLRFWGPVFLFGLCEILYVSYLLLHGPTVPHFDWLGGILCALAFPGLIAAHALHHIHNHGFPGNPTPTDSVTDRDLNDQ